MKLLLIVYKIEKDKGSEDGTGYHISEILAKKYQDITLISRNNNIEKLKKDPAFNHFNLISVDVPKALSFYKKKGRGIILYYYLWQIAVGLKVYQLQKNKSFDVIHQLNFHAMWAPHFIFSKAKIIWGPLTQHPDIPFQFWYEKKSLYIKEIFRKFFKFCFLNIDPFLKWSVLRTHKIILGQDKILGSYRNYSNKITIIPQARSSFPIITSKANSDIFNILFVGRFVSLKGCVLAMEAVRKMLLSLPEHRQDKVKVTFIGAGPLENKLRNQAINISKEIKAEISIVDWQDQPKLLDYYRKASLFLFPSFEAQGLVVAEALSQGCPVLCLGNSGPHTVVGKAAVTISQENAGQIITLLTEKLYSLTNEFWDNPAAYNKRIELALERAQYLTWQKMSDEIIEQYHG